MSTADCTTPAAHRFAPLAVAPLLDFLCEARDAAAQAAADHPAWLRALDFAWGFILEAEALEYDAEAAALRVPSATRAGRAYVANGACACEAFTKGAGVCWHRAAARLVRRALELRDAAEVEALAAELVAEAHAAGARWYGMAEGRAGARMRLAELADFAQEWDAAALSAQALAARPAVALAAA